MELQEHITSLEDQLRVDLENYDNLKSALEKTPWHDKDRKKIAADKLRIGSRIQKLRVELKQRKSEFEINNKIIS